MIHKTPEILKKEIGSRLRKLIRDSELSEDEILEGLHGVSSWESFKNYLTGRSFISIPNSFILGERFGCGYQYILTGEHEKNTAAKDTGDMEERLEEWKILYKAMANQYKLADETVKSCNLEIERLRAENEGLRQMLGAKSSSDSF